MYLVYFSGCLNDENRVYIYGSLFRIVWEVDDVIVWEEILIWDDWISVGEEIRKWVGCEICIILERLECFSSWWLNWWKWGGNWKIVIIFEWC